MTSSRFTTGAKQTQRAVRHSASAHSRHGPTPRRQHPRVSPHTVRADKSRVCVVRLTAPLPPQNLSFCPRAMPFMTADCAVSMLDYGCGPAPCGITLTKAGDTKESDFVIWSWWAEL